MLIEVVSALIPKTINCLVQNPWIFRDQISIENLENDMMTEDFIGVKIGDVNNSMIANVINQASELRSGHGIDLTYEDRFMTEGNIVEVEFSADVAELFGYQFTLMTEGLDIIDVTGRDIFDENYSVIENGMVISHNSDYAVHTSKGFIAMKVQVTASGWLSDMMRISSKVARAEAYVGSDLQIVDVNIKADHESNFKLYQNEPNPFSTSTKIAFELPKAMAAELVIYNALGQVVKVFDGQFLAGRNEVDWDVTKAENSGLYYYVLKTEAVQLTGRMVMKRRY